MIAPWALLAALASPQAPARPSFEVSVENVYLDVFVVRDGASVPGLQASDFEVRDDGLRQEVRLAQHEDLPLTVVLVFDASSSLRGQKLNDLQAASRALLAGLRERDEAALVGFSHDATTFPLAGKHAPLLCDACHKKDTRDFPAGRGTATRLTGIGAECVACHTDPHAGQLVVACQTCHTAQTFALSRYTHRNQRALRAFFAGRHLSATCSACHKPALINASRTPVPSYRTPTACVGCHTDVHRGALGPNCASCHRL